MLEKLNVVISSLSSSIGGDQSSLLGLQRLRLSLCLSLSKSGLNLNKYFYAVKCQATIPADMLDKQQQQQQQSVSLRTDISTLDLAKA